MRIIKRELEEVRDLLEDIRKRARKVLYFKSKRKKHISRGFRYRVKVVQKAIYRLEAEFEEAYRQAKKEKAKQKNQGRA